MKNLLLTTILSFVMASLAFGLENPEEKKCDKDEKKTENTVDSAAVEKETENTSKAVLSTVNKASKAQILPKDKAQVSVPVVEKEKETDEESVLSFNFIYYMVQKFKFSEVMD